MISNDWKDGWTLIPAEYALTNFKTYPMAAGWEWEHRDGPECKWRFWRGNVAVVSSEYRVRRKQPEWIEVSDVDAIREMLAHPDDEWEFMPIGDSRWLTACGAHASVGCRYRRRPRT